MACKEARFTMASSSTCTPPSPFYKLLENEASPQQATGYHKEEHYL